MKYTIGFDGGATKTRCVLGDTQGNILANIEAGPSNHQIIGINETKNTLQTLLNEVLSIASLKLNDIEFIFLGLAGADLPSDFDMLKKICKELFKEVSYEVANDAWIIMRSGTSEPFGAVSIYGTGANAGAINTEGDMKILRALSYNLGGAGGGSEIANDALHYAFRSNEETYTKSALETELPRHLNMDSIETLLNKIYPEYILDYADYTKIPPLVFKLAKDGDLVCQEILIRKGKVQGQMVNGVLKQANMIGTEFPVVLGGSIYKGESPYFIDAMKEVILEKSPKATFNYPMLQPVAGAYLFALDRLHLKLSDEEHTHLAQQLSL
ncbi:MAG: hypothetical protein JEZ08_17455 [Clostridiales bacterium]|nr:hypothetical protein [Clostridiales bacterium]